MLVLTQILRCGSGRQKEALTRLNWIHGLMSAKDDSGGCIVARHLGNPIDLLILRYWHTPEALARRTNWYYQDPWPLFPANEPEGIYQTQSITHNFEEALLTAGTATGGFILRSTFRVVADRWEDCLALWRAEDAALQSAGGLVSAGTYRCIENPEEVLRLVRLHDRDALEAASVQPDLVSIGDKLSAVTQPLAYPDLNIFEAECFEVVNEFKGHSPA